MPSLSVAEYHVQTEAERVRPASRQAELAERVRQMLAEDGYPVEAASTVIVTIASRGAGVCATSTAGDR